MADNLIVLETEQKYVLKPKKPYIFEGKEYPEIDLSGLERLTIKDAVDAQKNLWNQQEIASAMICETTTAFAREIAAKASGRPVEFFKLMPRGLNKQVVRLVQAHLNVEAKMENHVMFFEKPYFFHGEKYDSVDLNGLADLNSLNESAAENRLAREGFMITETSFNYLYACCLACMAAKLPEEFFTGLPLCELLKLKIALNDGGFFE